MRWLIQMFLIGNLLTVGRVANVTVVFVFLTGHARLFLMIVRNEVLFDLMQGLQNVCVAAFAVDCRWSFLQQIKVTAETVS